MHGYILRHAIVRKGDAQGAIAAHCGITRVRMSRLTRGRARLRRTEAERLAAHLDIPLELLFPAAEKNKRPAVPAAGPAANREGNLDGQHSECTTA